MLIMRHIYRILKMNKLKFNVQLNRILKFLLFLDRLDIVQHTTPFTYRSTLKINDVHKSDAQTYVCLGKSVTVNYDNCIGEQCIAQDSNLSEYASYTLIVYGI